MSRATRWKGSVKMGINCIGAVVFVLFAVLWHLSQDWQAWHSYQAVMHPSPVKGHNLLRV